MFSQPEPVWTWGIIAAVWAACALRDIYRGRRRVEPERGSKGPLLTPWAYAWLLIVGAVVVVSSALSPA